MARPIKKDLAKRYDYICSKCPENALFAGMDGRYYSLPDLNSDCCKQCNTYHNFMSEVFGVCEITGKYCVYSGDTCGPGCSIFHTEVDD